MPALTDKIAVVTGAAGTMGRAAARFLFEDGCRLVLLDLDRSPVHTLAQSLPGSSAMACDVGDADAVREVCRRIRAEVGEPDILVNNAGVLSNHKALQTDAAEWRRVFAANVDGALYLSQQLMPAMQHKRWGRIINVCSLAAKTGGLTAGTSYAASKGALTSLTFSLARELAPYGVTVNGISPAYVNTPMLSELTEAQRRKLLADIPVGRFCEPEEFAHAVRFLASPLAGFITGEIVDLNGGLLMD